MEFIRHTEVKMGINIRLAVLWTVILFLCFAVGRSDTTFAKDKKRTPQEVVAEHVKSIGSPEALASIKSRALNGDVSIEFIVGTSGLVAGQFEFVSEKQKQGLLFKFNALQYPGEHFAFDGKDVTVSYISPGGRSPLGDFLIRYDSIIKQGLMGGVLSVNWPLLDINKNRTRMKYKKRKMGGRELHELEYRPRKGMDDVKVKLFFDLDTFRHVKTEYKVSIMDLDTYYVLTEEFGDFQRIDGLMLPQSYFIQYSRTGSERTFLARWTMEILRWSHDTPIDPQFYRVP